MNLLWSSEAGMPSRTWLYDADVTPMRSKACIDSQAAAVGLPGYIIHVVIFDEPVRQFVLSPGLFTIGNVMRTVESIVTSLDRALIQPDLTLAKIQ